MILDSEQSLRQNEYKQPHDKRLKQSKGNLIVLKGTESIDEIRELALDKICCGRPNVTLIEDNGTTHKGCHWRAVKQDDGSYLVSILNLGKHIAQLELGLKDGSKISATDLFTGKSVETAFDLAPIGVSLLKLTAN